MCLIEVAIQFDVSLILHALRIVASFSAFKCIKHIAFIENLQSCTHSHVHSTQ